MPEEPDQRDSAPDRGFAAAFSPLAAGEEQYADARHQAISSPFSARSSPPELFPELDDDLESELADLSPCFAHEINSQAAPDFVPLPEPANGDVRNAGGRAISQNDVGEDFHDSGEMREATQSGLKWARMMFGKGVCDSEAKEDECADREGETKQ